MIETNGELTVASLDLRMFGCRVQLPVVRVLDEHLDRVCSFIALRICGLFDSCLTVLVPFLVICNYKKHKSQRQNLKNICIACLMQIAYHYT